MVINFLLPHYGLKPSGGFRIVYEYANGLSKKGHKVNIIHASTIKDDSFNYIKYIRSNMKKLFFYSEWSRINADVNMIYVPSLNEKYLPKADATVATAWQTSEYLVNYKEDKGKKFYLIQGYETWGGAKERIDNTWKFHLNLIVISKWLYDIGKALNVIKMEHIPNAINNEKYKVINNIKDRALIISMMYSKQEWKGSEDGIQALYNVYEKYPNIKVIFFGKDKPEKRLPDWIKFYKNPSQSVIVNEIYNKSAIFLSPSWFEGWGLPPMEAMACGCAVVTTDNGGVNDFVLNNVNSLVSPIKKPDELAKNIITLISNKNKRILLANNGVKTVKSFTWEKSISRFEKYILANL